MRCDRFLLNLKSQACLLLHSICIYVYTAWFVVYQYNLTSTALRRRTTTIDNTDARCMVRRTNWYRTGTKQALACLHWLASWWAAADAATLAWLDRAAGRTALN